MRKYRIRKINVRIALYFTTLIILIGIVISFINVRLYSQEVSRQMENVTTQKMGLILNRVNNTIADVKRIHSSIINDKSINLLFARTVSAGSAENIKALADSLDQLTDSKIKSIIALGLNSEVYNPISNFPAYRNLTSGNPDYDYMVRKQVFAKFSTPNTFPLDSSGIPESEMSNITFYGQFRDIKTFELLGYLAINFNRNYLFNEINALALDAFDTTYIVDENNHLIYQTGTMDFDKVSQSLDSGKVKIGHNDFTLYSERLPEYYGWRLIGIFDNSLISLRTRNLNIIISLVLLFFIFLMMVISWFISKNITNPIKQVVQSMNEFEQGRWPEPLTTRNEDEIKSLIKGYNRMLTSFISLTDKIINRHEENKEMELDLIKTQIGLLEAQINPHFIHNTLNSMNYLAIKEGNLQLSELIQSFNKLLRMSMAIDVNMVTVIQEIQNIKEYAMIQNIRFENAFTIHYDIAPDVVFGKIPKLILQPVVENSIIHGILPKKKQGKINIKVSREDGMLVVQIADNGVGFNEDNIGKIFSSSPKNSLSQHIGLKNVKDRLQLLYDSGFEFSIATAKKGTTVVLKIPYKD